MAAVILLKKNGALIAPCPQPVHILCSKLAAMLKMVRGPAIDREP
jgi:hypothetical protein